MKGRSIVTNLILYSNYISQALDKYRQVDSIYLDFDKAFDNWSVNILVSGTILQTDCDSEFILYYKSFTLI